MAVVKDIELSELVYEEEDDDEFDENDYKPGDYRLATSRPLGERSEPFLAAKQPISPRSGRPRATKSREVDLSRLQGFHSHFAPKMGSGVTRSWG